MQATMSASELQHFAGPGSSELLLMMLAHQNVISAAANVPSKLPEGAFCESIFPRRYMIFHFCSRIAMALVDDV
jgi:hypothetical protein